MGYLYIWLAARVGRSFTVSFELDIIIYSVSVSDPGRSDVSLLQEARGTEKALSVRHGSRWLCPFRWVSVKKWNHNYINYFSFLKNYLNIIGLIFKNYFLVIRELIYVKSIKFINHFECCHQVILFLFIALVVSCKSNL